MTSVLTAAAATSGTRGIWLSPSELSSLPTSGSAWNAITSRANSSWGSADISNQDSDHDIDVLAGALVAARTGNASMRAKVVAALEDAPESENGGRTLALGRNLPGYVIAADLIGYRDASFVSWVQGVRHETLDGRTLISTHEDRPNNWGTHAGAARLAASAYLGDTADIARAAQVFRGWVGDRSSYAGFDYGDLSWQCSPSQPVGINPAGCTIDGHNVDGVLPDDQRRGGGFTWPAPRENYVWEALQGATVQAQLLHRLGYDAWNWEDRAILRAVEWLHGVNNYPAGGDDTWNPWLINYAYGTDFPASSPSNSGKNMGFTDWTHTGTAGPLPDPEPTSDPEPTPDPEPTADPEPTPEPTTDRTPDSDPEPSGGPVDVADVVTGSSSSGTSVSTSDAISGASDGVYVAAVSTKTHVATSGVSGLGLSWQEVDTQCSGRSQTGVSVWVASGSTSGGAVSASLDSSPSNASVAVARLTGANVSDPVAAVAAGNSNGGSCSGGTDADTYRVSVPGGDTVLGAVALRHKSHTTSPDTELIETHSGSGGSASGLAMTISDDSTLEGTISGDVDYAVVGIALRGTGDGGATSEPDPTPTSEPDPDPTPTADPDADVSSGGPVEIADLETGSSSSSTSVTTNDAISGHPSSVYVVAVSTKTHVATTGVSGLGLSWQEVDTQCSGRSQTGVSVWVATGSTSGGTVTASFSDAPSNASLAVVRVAGADLSDPIAAVAATNTNGGSCSGGTDTNSYGFDVSGTGGHTVLGAIALRHKSHTTSPDTELTEIHSGSGGSASGLALTASDDRTLEGTISGDVDYAAVGIAIHSAS